MRTERQRLMRRLNILLFLWAVNFVVIIFLIVTSPER